MNRNQKLIIGIVLIVIVAFSGSLLAWFLFFRDFPGDVVFYYPDLTISDYSLEDDNLEAEITNIGDLNTTGVIIVAEIDSLDLTLYNNSQTPVDLQINEMFNFSVDLRDFASFFTSGNTYTIKIQVDPNDDIIEENENNNEITVDYYYVTSPSLSLFPPNTYSLNSTIDTFGYAIVFNASEIILDDSLIITNGTINGYTVVNSTILENTTVLSSEFSITIALYSAQNLTIRNIWNSRLCVVLCDQSKLSLINCSIQQLLITGSNNIVISNSTVEFITTIQTLVNLASLRILDNSKINYCFISCAISLDIEFANIHNFYIIASAFPYSQQKGYYITGSVRNCTIYGMQVYGQTILNIYGTDIYQVNLVGNTKLNLIQCVIDEVYVYQQAFCTFDKSEVLSELNYGIIVSSGSVNITNGVIQGTSFLNNTLLINSNVAKTTLMSLTVNNTGKVSIYNFSCNIFVYDNAEFIITDTNPTEADSNGVYLEGSSSFIGSNSSFGFVYCQGNGALNLSKECSIQTLFINSTNNIQINNCSCNEIAWFSEHLGGYTAEIINSTVGDFQAPPSCQVDIINSSIDHLYEGIKFQSGINVYNTSGIFGGGSISNYLNISGSTINQRTYKYIEITGGANVVMEDLYNEFSITIESGDLSVRNCTFDLLQMRNDAVVYLDNCTAPDKGSFASFMTSLFGPQTIICLEDSQLYINNSKLLDGNLIFLYNNAQMNINDSIVFAVQLFHASRATIVNSDLWSITIVASSLVDYALKLINCTTQGLLTYSWNFFNL
ncbi:MAG: CARDB domain-containing protein [Promethearchaeota archaeon]